MKINKEKLKKNLFIPIIISLVVIGIAYFSKSFAMYSSLAESNANIDLAFSLLNLNQLEETIKLSDIKPDSVEREFCFEVSNFDGNKLIDVNLEYTVSVIATTNLPLTFNLTDINGNAISTTSEFITDEHNTIFYVIKTNNYNVGYRNQDTKSFKLTYKLDSQYDGDEYQDIIELITVRIDAKQV